VIVELLPVLGLLFRERPVFSAFGSDWIVSFGDRASS